MTNCYLCKTGKDGCYGDMYYLETDKGSFPVCDRCVKKLIALREFEKGEKAKKNV